MGCNDDGCMTESELRLLAMFRERRRNLQERLKSVPLTAFTVGELSIVLRITEHRALGPSEADLDLIERRIETIGK